MDTRQSQQEQEQDQIQFLKEWHTHERAAAKFAADAAKARAWRVLRHRRQTAMFNIEAQPCTQE